MIANTLYPKNQHKINEKIMMNLRKLKNAKPKSKLISNYKEEQPQQYSTLSSDSKIFQSSQMGNFNSVLVRFTNSVKKVLKQQKKQSRNRQKKQENDASLSIKKIKQFSLQNDTNVNHENNNKKPKNAAKSLINFTMYANDPYYEQNYRVINLYNNNFFAGVHKGKSLSVSNQILPNFLRKKLEKQRFKSEKKRSLEVEPEFVPIGHIKGINTQNIESEMSEYQISYYQKSPQLSPFANKAIKMNKQSTQQAVYNRNKKFKNVQQNKNQRRLKINTEPHQNSLNQTSSKNSFNKIRRQSFAMYTRSISSDYHKQIICNLDDQNVGPWNKQ